MTPIAGFRRVQTLHGDTLQRIAARELGDAARWTELAAMNKLSPPYLTGDESAVGPRVLRYGDTLMVPAPAQDIRVGDTTAEAIFGADLALPKGGLRIDGGDVGLVDGRDNLRQALEHRVRTETGELMFHTEYGSGVHAMRGARANPAAMLLAAKFAERCVREDDRIADVASVTAVADGETIRVELIAETVTGHPLNITPGV